VAEWCTQQARQVIAQAQEEARAMGHRTVKAEYLLLGLLSNQDGIAGRLLADLGVTLGPARNLVRERLGSRSDQTPDGQIPFSPGAQEVFRWASRWAFPLGGHDEVGSEHLLAGIAHLNDGARQILRALDVDPAVVRFEIKKRVAAPGELDTGPSLRIRSVPLRHVAQAWDPEWPLRPCSLD
jgi:ATP-dependent Clp protease ATP-binding subunit ClpA